jgi:hypothetical protein
MGVSGAPAGPRAVLCADLRRTPDRTAVEQREPAAQYLGNTAAEHRRDVEPGGAGGVTGRSTGANAARGERDCGGDGNGQGARCGGAPQGRHGEATTWFDPADIPCGSLDDVVDRR